MIRVATIDDLEIIVQYNLKLAKETENLTLDEETVRKGVMSVIEDRTKGSYYLYQIDDEIIGQLLITYEWSDWRNKNFWWIQSVYVNKNHRNNKVFSRLYGYIESLAKDMGACGLRLYVEQNNTAAQTIYTSLGLEKSHYYLFETNFNKMDK